MVVRWFGVTVDDIGQEGGEVVGRWKELHRQELAEFDWKNLSPSPRGFLLLLLHSVV